MTVNATTISAGEALRVLDVSIGGCALFLPEDVPALTPGESAISRYSLSEFGSDVLDACGPRVREAAKHLRVIDGMARRDIDTTGAMKGMDSFTSRAFDMVASGAVRKALDLTKEDPRVRDRYKGIEQFLADWKKTGQTIA